MMYMVVTRNRCRAFPTLDKACNYGALLEMCGIWYTITDACGNPLE